MANNEPSGVESRASDELKSRNALVFISHDTRDAAIAEAFSKLLSSVSAGVLKSFRSSDKRGTQGIEYGVEWYPEIMKKLEAASDVVCLLTPFSINRPWILYEAGVAKGKLDTSVHGLALGIPLSTASTGPFAQFQNSDDDEQSLIGLVVQLVKRIPNSEPDHDVIKDKVDQFKEKVRAILDGSQPKESEPKEKADDTAVVKIFEEIKVMYQDLPSRVANRIERPLPTRRFRRLRPDLLSDIASHGGNDPDDPILILMAGSLFRDEFPWVYELAVETYQAARSKRESEKAGGLANRLIKVAEASIMHPEMQQMFGPSGAFSERRRDEAQEYLHFLHYACRRYR
ncbi:MULTISPECIES: toll/interleukin-1 receptor domain-containing protein [Ralstonia solanacearum species complex]|uniref:toll/interleukin-1 receptor domain-containing protein n=1 Tax=Ralstonia solanacearum species complex TaxID=3116862 RepID=UPI0020044049|nr:toll/interleukin-1 receptor domain-containing protein [Ralstonia pseudosolanacearum]MCK4125640.1 toll/interleukin-1 receptor domain-containing protein [Ralstonia pseudosolanacearum]MDO3524918.1 toll/interleukin-1 receptor domain-containing protein [Ralstonia pseudosolanacearum]MDO3549265.1 toll/interleukin-1 receptor domain-containing protein [Ralstonia pseudosolanacearum]MDO3554582.1 toll/interleukin-1 receptor domain-containing protein [Ralstonia pseudosolanacearum]MDO3569313.1 toll/inter